MLQYVHEADLSFCRWEVTVSSMAKSGWALTCALSDRALGRRQVAPNNCRAIALRSNGTIEPSVPILPDARILATLRSAPVAWLRSHHASPTRLSTGNGHESRFQPRSRPAAS